VIFLPGWERQFLKILVRVLRAFLERSTPFQTKIYDLGSISDLALKIDTSFKTSKISATPNDVSLAKQEWLSYT